MKLDKATHKRELYVAMSAAKFPIEKLADASSAAKKLLAGAERTEQSIVFQDSEQDFTAEEWIILKDTVRGVNAHQLEGADAILELRKLLEV